MNIWSSPCSRGFKICTHEKASHREGQNALCLSHQGQRAGARQSPYASLWKKKNVSFISIWIKVYRPSLPKLHEFSQIFSNMSYDTELVMHACMVVSKLSLLKTHTLTSQTSSAAVIITLKIIVLGVWQGFFSPKCFSFHLPIHELKDTPYTANRLSQNMS